MADMKKKKEKKTNRDHVRFRNEMHALCENTIASWQKACSVFENLIMDKNCPWWIESYELRCLFSLSFARKANEDDTFNLYESPISKAMDIWAAHPNTDTFRQYIRILNECIDNGWDSEMFVRAKVTSVKRAAKRSIVLRIRKKHILKMINVFSFIM